MGKLSNGSIDLGSFGSCQTTDHSCWPTKLRPRALVSLLPQISRSMYSQTWLPRRHLLLYRMIPKSQSKPLPDPVTSRWRETHIHTADRGLKRWGEQCLPDRSALVAPQMSLFTSIAASSAANVMSPLPNLHDCIKASKPS